VDPQIFISYSSKDQKVARTICTTLENRGLACWISFRNVKPGQNHQEQIVKAIRSARLMVLVFTAQANNSNEIKKELALASQNNLVVIPVRIEDVTPSGAFAYELATRQWIDMFDDWENSIANLVELIATSIDEHPSGDRAQAAAELTGDAAAPSSKIVKTETAPAAAPTSSMRRPSLRWAIICGVAVIGAVGIAYEVVPLTRQSVSVSVPISGLSPGEGQTLKRKSTFQECRNCPQMIVVPAGSFTMGSPTNEPQRGANEGPQHRVIFARQFAVGKFAVTFDEWDACVADGGCNGYEPDDQGWGRGQRPVINVPFDSATNYVAWLSHKTGNAYRLLTEAEWEYAARGGTSTAYYWGDEIGKGNAVCVGCGSKWDGKQTAPVGSFAANQFGLFDMAGNATQWVQDCYELNYLGAPADGSAWTRGTALGNGGGDCGHRVVRGGSWHDGPQGLRMTYRTLESTAYRSFDLGFRVGRTLTP
jgi:formylglycine-generating enzyme required for sulfatase activity